MLQRKIDELGRIVLPKEMMCALGITTCTPVNVSVADSKIVIEKTDETCKLCGSVDDVVHNEGICRKCVERIKTKL